MEDQGDENGFYFLSEDEFLAKHGRRYDRPAVQASEGYQDDESEGVWRYVADWTLYRVSRPPHGKKKKKHQRASTPSSSSRERFSCINDFPKDDIITDRLVLRGTLVDANGDRCVDALQLDGTSCSCFCLDRSKAARGWWVCSKRGDYYRLLQPSVSVHLEQNGGGDTGDNNTYLHRRAVLALISNLLDLVFVSAEATADLANLPAEAALAPYIQRMRNDHGIDVVPVLACYKTSLYHHLVGSHEALTDRCTFFATLKQLTAAGPIPDHDLLRVTVAAETLSQQEPWGLALPPQAAPGYFAETARFATPSPTGTVASAKNEVDSDSGSYIEQSLEDSSNDPDYVFTMHELELQYGPDYFDHPQCAAGYEIDFCLDYPWRFIDQWTTYPKDQKRESATAKAAVELPYDGNMRDYIVDGYLVAPDGVRARVRLDNLMMISFDRSKDTRGWWVSAHNGDGKTQAVYYRFLDPDTSVLPKGGARRNTHHLRRRAHLALLSNILDVCFPTEEHANYRASQPVQVALQDYRMRLADEGIRLFPLLSMFKRELQVHLAYSFTALKPRCDFFTSLASMRDVKHPSTATLLALTEIAEVISDQSQWGYPRTTESSSETLSVVAPKRLKDPPCEVDGRTKKQRVDPISPTGSSAATLATTPKMPKVNLMSLEDFKSMLRMMKDGNGDSITIEHVEKWDSVRHGGKCKSHQYGRILPDAMERVFDMTGLSRDDTFIDIGSGIGTLVLQAAYTRGCVSRGIEVLQGRHDAALIYADHAACCKRTFPGLKPGMAQFFCGDLRSSDNSKVFLKNRSSRRIVGFCNNFGGLMGARSETNAGVSVEHYIAGQFASWDAGSVLVTLFPLLCLGKPRDKALYELKKHSMDEGDPSWASFYCVEEFALGPQNKVASWSAYGGCEHAVTAYKYTRLAQVGQPDSVLRCLNPSCPTAQSGEAIYAVKRDHNGMPLINACSCGYEQRNLRDGPQTRGYCEPDRATSSEI